MITSADKVAQAWEDWCGVTQWSKYVRELHKYNCKINWFCGFPQSHSATPLTFTIIMPDGKEFGHSKLRDLKEAVKLCKQLNKAKASK